MNGTVPSAPSLSSTKGDDAIDAGLYVGLFVLFFVLFVAAPISVAYWYFIVKKKKKNNNGGAPAVATTTAIDVEMSDQIQKTGTEPTLPERPQNQRQQLDQFNNIRVKNGAKNVGGHHHHHHH